MKNFKQHKFVLNEIEVDPKASLIIRNGIAKRLEPKVISLLSYFASRPDQVISRQELMKDLWPNVVVADEIITRAIFSLRNALGDNAQNPIYIETIPKKGYRFLAKATFCEEAKTPVSKMFVASFAVATALLLIISIIFWLPEPSTEIHQILPFTSMKGTEYNFSLSERSIDAARQTEQKMVFVSQNETKNQIIVKSLENETTQIIVDDDWIKKSPRWLDQDALIYIRCKPDDCQIVRQFVSDNPQIIYKTNHPINQIELIKDQPLLILSESRNNASTELILLNLLNGKVEPLRNKIPLLPNRAYHPTYSKHNNHLIVIGIEAQKPSIYEFDFKSSELIGRTDSYDMINSISNGLLEGQLLVVGMQSGTNGIWQHKINNDSTELLLRISGAEQILSAVANPQNNTIFYANYLQDYNINQLSLNGAKDELTELNSDALDLFGKYIGNQQILFISNRSGFAELWLFDQTNQTTTKITQLKASDMWSPQVSNSGEYVALVYKQQELTLAVLNIKTGEVVISTNISTMKFPLAWSLDDETIYVSEHNKDVNLFKYDRKTLTQTVLLNLAGLFAKEIDNGHSLVTFDYQKNAFVNIELDKETSTITTKAITQKIDNSKYLAPGSVLLQESSVIIAFTQDTHTQLIQYPLLSKFSQTEPVILPTDITTQMVFDISPDAKNLLVHTRKADRGDIMEMTFKN